ncbi:protein-export chaperone SecB [Hahella sp. KA22]|uniref:Protein-export protein SecB n=1 Tax=Hahella chejuensis (strain KCTC 2396) TaxID=349521 RepID=SECB_HAHCH|nr:MULTISPECIES: protein-export chaperone SecB [Hahella]Q2SMA3.1 RecName: Full=Protein-export protein SecB [Hahella chejuensis KCTC 2396]ABC28221.1 protein-export protein SecB [Hahella chejuensis KCTC 2396]AZZ94037.1 protein-export chaperone SecB [Hahella sp. KA22]MDG9671398.1 protein-export chaperone SecB [Hahella sp. CR1]QAY57411.1 protein-export chaperone SecB [Hahella sp. KA22]WLQ11889.1 protein-export chaperone SecB [Hahella sp. HNIBRBA332]
MSENAEAPKQPVFALQRIYLKDLSFESPNSPAVFQSEWKPQVNMDLNTENKKVSDNQWEVVLTLTITAKLADKTAFVIEVQQAGVFMIDGLSPQQLAQTLGAFCPNILFPYARETIDMLAVKGSFPALMLQPVNFDAIYAEAVKRQQAQQAAPAEEAKH